MRSPRSRSFKYPLAAGQVVAGSLPLVALLFVADSNIAPFAILTVIVNLVCAVIIARQT
jgi:hypothetical protein